MARLGAGELDAAAATTAGATVSNASAKIGSQNVMGMGAPKGKRVDQRLKLNCMVSMWEHRKWSAVLLADVRYTDQGFREVEVEGKAWTVVHNGKVAI